MELAKHLSLRNHTQLCIIITISFL